MPKQSLLEDSSDTIWPIAEGNKRVLEPIYYDFAIQHINHFITETHPPSDLVCSLNKTIQLDFQKKCFEKPNVAQGQNIWAPCDISTYKNNGRWD